MTQAARLESLERFRQGQAAFLLATDVAARGLDISGVQVRALRHVRAGHVGIGYTSTKWDGRARAAYGLLRGRTTCWRGLRRPTLL